MESAIKLFLAVCSKNTCHQDQLYYAVEGQKIISALGEPSNNLNQIAIFLNDYFGKNQLAIDFSKPITLVIQPHISFCQYPNTSFQFSS